MYYFRMDANMFIDVENSSMDPIVISSDSEHSFVYISSESDSEGMLTPPRHGGSSPWRIPMAPHRPAARGRLFHCSTPLSQASYSPRSSRHLPTCAGVVRVAMCIYNYIYMCIHVYVEMSITEVSIYTDVLLDLHIQK